MAIVCAITGLARFDIPSLIYGAEFAGIAIMFVGFLKAVEWAKAHRKGTTGPVLSETPRELESPDTPSTAPK